MARYHVQSWVQRNTPKLAGYAQSLSKPALTVGKGAVSLIIELFTLFVLVLLLLLEGPKMWSWTLGQMTPGRQATVTRIAADVSRKVTGYMAGNLLTSLIAGTVVFVTLLILGVPFPLLWGLWVALVDFLPMIGGALAGIPTVLFAFIAGGLTAGIVTAVVFAVYTQIENHVLNPVVMSKTVRINPLLVFIAVLAGASIGSLIGGIFGGFVAALLAIPTAGALQVLVKEVWQATAPDQPQESPAPAAEPADESRCDPVAPAPTPSDRPGRRPELTTVSARPAAGTATGPRAGRAEANPGLSVAWPVTGLGLSGGWARSVSTTRRPTPKRQNLVCTQHGTEPCISVARPGQQDTPESQGFAARRRLRHPAACPAGRWTAPGRPKKCFVIRGGGEMENHFECLWTCSGPSRQLRPRAPAALALVTLAGAVHWRVNPHGPSGGDMTQALVA